MADLRTHSSTSNIVRFTLKRADTGQGLTGLTSATLGLIISTIADNEATATAYPQTISKIETITTLGTFAAPTAGKCRFREVDASNHPGLYEFQFEDSRFAVSGAKRLVISVSGAGNLLSADYEIRLTAFDPDDAAGLGLSRVDAAISSRMATFTLPANFSLLVITAEGAVSNVVLVATTTTNTDMRGTDNALLAATYLAPLDAAGTRSAVGLAAANLDAQLADLPTVAEFNARTLTSASYGTAATQAAMNGKLDTLLVRITATLFAGITSLGQWLGLLAGKQAGDATALTEIKATGAGIGTYDPTTDSTEAIRDRGDAAWTGGGGGGGTNVNVEQSSVVIKGSSV